MIRFVCTNLYEMDLTDVISIVCGAAGGGIVTQIVNWRINRKKGIAEAKNAEAEASNTLEDARSKEIENVRKSVEVYQTIIADQNKRISELTEEVQQIRRERERRRCRGRAAHADRNQSQFCYS